MNKIVITKRQKLKSFIKSYGYIFLVGIVVVAFSIALVFTLTSKDGKIENPAMQVGTETITFISPIANGIVIKDYSAKELQLNETLKQWEIHRAVDFANGTADEVLAVYAGEVANIYTNYLEGTVIIIDHGNNLKTVYKSLDSNVQVKIGDNVAQGTVLSKISTSMAREASMGPHLHFEVYLQDKLVDPNNYLQLSAK